jgi:hypothetical protein
VCRGRSNACNPLAPRIDKNLGNPVVKKVKVRTLADRRGIRLFSVNKPLFLASLPGSKLVYIIWFAYNLVLYLVYLLFAISNTYYLENHFVLFLFLFLFLSCCLDGVHQSTRGRTREITKGLR